MNTNHTPTLNALVKGGMRVVTNVSQQIPKPCCSAATVEFALVEPMGEEYVYATVHFPSLDDLEAHVAAKHVGAGI